MRSWVEKLAKLIEVEGKQIGVFDCKILNYEIYFIPGNNTSYLIVTNTVSKEKPTIKLYEEEIDLIKKAFDRCKEKTTNYIIEQLNNL